MLRLRGHRDRRGARRRERLGHRRRHVVSPQRSAGLEAAHDLQLEPLLAYGMQADAKNRVLYAEAQGNGVTGFVAATGKSYLCEDTGTDPLYLPGAPGARSSLTVPSNSNSSSFDADGMAVYSNNCCSRKCSGKPGPPLGTGL